MGERIRILEEENKNHAEASTRNVELMKKVEKLEDQVGHHQKVNQYIVKQLAKLSGRCKAYEEREALRKQKMGAEGHLKETEPENEAK